MSEEPGKVRKQEKVWSPSPGDGDQCWTQPETRGTPQLQADPDPARRPHSHDLL